MSERINSKKKGSKNERELCKLMQDWTGYEFARVPSSGGLRWKDTDNTVGDIICTDARHGRRFRFAVETKFYQDINFEHLILGNKKVKINEFWDQALADGARAKKEPILFMRYNGMPKQMYFVMMDYNFFLELPHEDWEREYANFIIQDPTTKSNRIVINSHDLLKLDYQQTHKILKQWLRKKYGA